MTKKINLIKNIQESKKIKTNIYNFIGIYHSKNQKEINNINKSEIILWNNIIQQKNKRYSESNIGILKDLFKKIIFDKYYKLFDKFNNLENKIILNLMKKHKYNIGKKSDIKNNGSMNKINNNNNKKIITASPIQQLKNNIKQNKNVNNKKRTKKKSTGLPVKSTNYFLFKTSYKK